MSFDLTGTLPRTHVFLKGGLKGGFKGGFKGAFKGLEGLNPLSPR